MQKRECDKGKERWLAEECQEIESLHQREIQGAFIRKKNTQIRRQ